MARHAFLTAVLAAAVALSACGAPARAPSLKSASTAPVTPAASSAPAPDTWAALGPQTPLWILRNVPGPVSDPTRARDLAVCASTTVQVSRDGGKTWTSVPTAGVVAATAGTPYPVAAQGGGAGPACTSALADPAHPQTVYAVFAAGPAGYGMPPVYRIPLYTVDGGTRWQVVAPPTGLQPGGFGGFRQAGGGVQAIFGSAATASGPRGPAFGVTETTDGGRSWKAALPACPAGGPCVAWGPAPSGTGSCAMSAYPQPVLASGDGGKTWAALPAPSGSPLPMLVNGCGLNQLAALSATRLALIANEPAAAADVLRVSDDGGQTWTSVALPALPGGGSTQALEMLPDGSLIAPVLVQTAPGRYGSQVELLRPSAGAWCAVPGVTLAGTAAQPTTLQAAGGRLWWVEGGTAAPAVRSVPLASVHC